MTSQGTRCTRSARRENTPTSPDTSVPRRSSRRAPSRQSAGMRDRATARATTTTETPAALTARMKSMSSTMSPASEIATVRAEKTTVRPARSHGGLGGPHHLLRRELRGGRSLEQGAQLLTEPADHEQAVVDAQSEPEHGDDVDDRGVELQDVGEGQERGEGARDRGDGAEDGEAGGEEAAEHHDHDEEAHGEGDALAALAVDLDLLHDPVDERAQATTFRARRAGVLDERVEDLVDLRRRLGLLRGGDGVVEGDDRREAPRRGVAVEDELEGPVTGRALGHHEGVDRRLDVVDRERGRPRHPPRPVRRSGRRGRHPGRGGCRC